MTITKFDKQNLSEVRKAINEALAKVSADFSVDFKIGNISYNPEGTLFSTKLEAQISGGESKEASDFKHYATMYGLKPEMLGAVFTMNRDTYTITGCASRSSKFPILGKSLTSGKSFKFDADSVKRALAVA